MKRQLLLLTFGLIVSICANAQIYFVDSIAYIILKEKRTTPIRGAKIWYNGVAMDSCKSVPYMGMQEAYCTTKKIAPPRHNYEKFHIRVEHPDFAVLDDSLYLTNEIFLFKPTDTYFYASNKIPTRKYEGKTMVWKSKMSLEELKELAEKTGGVYIESYDACPHFKGDGGHGFGPNLHVFQHKDEKDRIRFSKKTDASPMVGGSEAYPSRFGLSRQITISYLGYLDKIGEVEKLLDKLKSSGQIRDYYVQRMSIIMIQINLEPGDEFKANEIIEELMRSNGYLEHPVQEPIMFQCPG